MIISSKVFEGLTRKQALYAMYYLECGGVQADAYRKLNPGCSDNLAYWGGWYYTKILRERGLMSLLMDKLDMPVSKRLQRLKEILENGTDGDALQALKLSFQLDGTLQRDVNVQQTNVQVNVHSWADLVRMANQKQNSVDVPFEEIEEDEEKDA